MAAIQQLIAKKAGVSRTTVSVVLNGKLQPAISEATRSKVWQTAKELNYETQKPRLKPMNGCNIGILLRRGVSDFFRNPFYGPITVGIEEEMKRCNFDAAFAFSEGQLKEAIGSTLINNKCEGVVLLGQVDSEVVDSIKAYNIKRVAVSSVMPNIESILVDNRQAIQLAINHLIKKGHRNIAYVGGNSTFYNFKERLEYYKSEMLLNGLKFKPELIISGEGTIEHGEKSAEKLYKMAGKFTAVLAANDLIALGLMHKLKIMGISVPEDISVIGIDDIEESKRSNLTTIAVPKEKMGRLAIQRLAQQALLPQVEIVRNIVSVSLENRGTVNSVSNKKSIL